MLALATTLSTSFVPTMVRGAALYGLDLTAILFVRLAGAVLLLVVTIGIHTPSKLRVDTRGLRLIVAVGLVSGVEICCFFWTLAYVDASTTIMVKSLQPLVVLLLLTLWGHRITRRHLTRLALAVSGVYLLVGATGRPATIGLLLLFGSVFLYSLQLVLAHKWLGEYDSRTVTVYLLATMTAVSGVLWWIQGTGWRSPGMNGWFIIAALTVVGTYFARLTLYGAIRRIGSGEVALLWPLQTLLSVLLSVLFLAERLSPARWAGGLLIMASVLLAIPHFREALKSG